MNEFQKTYTKLLEEAAEILKLSGALIDSTPRLSIKVKYERKLDHLRRQDRNFRLLLLAGDIQTATEQMFEAKKTAEQLLKIARENPLEIPVSQHLDAATFLSHITTTMPEMIRQAEMKAVRDEQEREVVKKVLEALFGKSR